MGKNPAQPFFLCINCFETDFPCSCFHNCLRFILNGRSLSDVSSARLRQTGCWHFDSFNDRVQVTTAVGIQNKEPSATNVKRLCLLIGYLSFVVHWFFFLSDSSSAYSLGAFTVRINTEVAIFTHCLRWKRVGVPCVPNSDQHRDSRETAKLDKIPEYLRDTMDWFMG